ncbi:MAG: beta-methylgalactoside transporter, partial [Oscillospiraceae bacterium]
MMTKNKLRGAGEFLINNAVVFLMVGAALVVGILEPNFISGTNIRNLISNTAVRFIIALGVSGCLISKGTDLSAGRQVGLSACIAATFLQDKDYASRVYPSIGELPIIVVFLAIVVIFVIIGLVNGLVISVLKVPPFIATLGMQTVIYGICLVFTGSQPIGGLRKEYTDISSGSLFGIEYLPYLGIIALVIGLIMWFLYNKTPHGKYMYAIGGNESSAEVSGINTTKTKVMIYILASVLYAVAGFVLGGKS